MNNDPVNHPSHYTDGPDLGKLECLDITRWLPFNLGNAFKYVWRAGNKNPERFAEDLEKAIFYLADWKHLEPWHATLYQGRAPAEAFLYKVTMPCMEAWKYNTLRHILRSELDDAIDTLRNVIRVVGACEKAEMKNMYPPEDETDDPD